MHPNLGTGPIQPVNMIRTKIEAVLIGVALTVSSLITLTMMLSPTVCLIAVVTIADSLVSAKMILLWFRMQAKRSNFGRRQTSSRVATVAEALSSIPWAGTAGLWIAGPTLTILVIAFIGIILFLTRLISQSRSTELSGQTIFRRKRFYGR